MTTVLQHLMASLAGRLARRRWRRRRWKRWRRWRRQEDLNPRRRNMEVATAREDVTY